MKFNYGLEKKKFDENWEKIRREYREAGMDEESIEKMYEYDWEVFKKERLWCRHNQYLDSRLMCVHNEVRESTHDSNPLFHIFFDQFSCVISEEDFEDDHAWMETIEDAKLYEAIMSLNDDQKRILKLRVMDDYTMQEIADLYGITFQSIDERLDVIFKKIKKFMNCPEKKQF